MLVFQAQIEPIVKYVADADVVTELKSGGQLVTVVVV